MRFEKFELDGGTRELRTEGRSIRLQEQPFVILQLLLERRGQVVTRDELRERLWPVGTFVDFEHSLNAAIKRLRAALGDDADTPRFIETIPRRGYRFIAIAGEPHAPSVSAPTHRVRIAVLPFAEVGERTQHDYFGHAFTDEMISQLGRRCRERLGVISSHSSMAFRNTTARSHEIGAALRADYLLEGTIRHNDGRVRITARLVETAGETQLWVDTYEQPLTDWLTAQTEIAARIARSLAVELDAEDPAATIGSRNPAAYRAYLKGRYHWHRSADSGIREALQYFQEAAEVDPTFAAAHAGIAIVDVMHATYYHVVPRHALERARESVERALQLDRTSADAHFVLGDVRRMLLLDAAGAREAYSHAIALNPSFESARGAYSRLLASLGDFAQATREAEIARALDPRCLTANTIAAWARYLTGDFDAAVDLCRHTLEMDEGHFWARQVLGAALVAAGSRREAVRVLEAAVNEAAQNPLAVSSLAYARAMMGDRPGAVGLLTRAHQLRAERYVSPYHLALAHTALGEIDHAFTELERASHDRDPFVTNVAVDPRFAPLRSDKRFAALLTHLRLYEFHRRFSAA